MRGSRRRFFQPVTRDLGRIVLLVAVDRDDDGAACLGEARGERGRLAEVPAQPHDPHVVGACMQACEGGERAIRRAVVDEDGLPVSERIECGLQLLVEQRDASLLVVHGDDDGDHVEGD